jgi:uncharacterized repeat protein (TIGR01451 family)
LEAPADEASQNATADAQSLVTLSWIGPTATQAGQEAEYTLVVSNRTSLAVPQVAVGVKLPAGMTATPVTPNATAAADMITWQLGNLLPRQERRVQMMLTAASRGEARPQAAVTFTGSSTSALRIQVQEVKLALKVAGPRRVSAGDPANFTLTVTNTGDGPASKVKLRANLSEGLGHARGKTVDFEVGDLAADEARTVQLACLARAGGEQRCSVVVETGNVTVSEVIPAGFKFISAPGGQHTADVNTVNWFLGELAPGEARQVQLELKAVKAGEHRHKVTASSERGYKVEVSRELATRVEDFSALTLDVAHADEAIEGRPGHDL